MNPRDVQRIDDEAAEWIGRHDGGLDAAAQAEFERWMLVDARHAAAFARLEQCAAALDRLAAVQGARTEAPAPAAIVRWRRPVWALAAAAVLTVAVLVGTRFSGGKNFEQLATTAVGEARTLRLPDGSRIVLNTDSAVAVRYGPETRAIELGRGEAHFEVAKDARRPFTVRVGGVAVRAVGTAFNVRRQADSVEVLVTAGRVAVQETRDGRSLIAAPGAAPADAATSAVPAGAAETPGAAAPMAAPVLTAGQRMRVSGIAGTEGARPWAAAPEAVPAPDVERRLAWRERRLEFGPTPLVELLAEFNRYSARRLVIVDPTIERTSVGGAFRTGDAETLVQLLETNFDIAAERQGGEIRLRRASGTRN